MSGMVLDRPDGGLLPQLRDGESSAQRGLHVFTIVLELELLLFESRANIFSCDCSLYFSVNFFFPLWRLTDQKGCLNKTILI